MKYIKIKLSHGTFIKPQDFSTCVNICKLNKIKPTKKAIIAAYMSYFI